MEGLTIPSSDGREADERDLDVLAPLLAVLSIHVIDPAKGLVACPFKFLHTKVNGDYDCKVYINNLGGLRVPRLFCFHSSCTESINKVNASIQQIVANGAANLPPTAHPAPIRATNRKAFESAPAVASNKAARAVIAKYPWTYRDIQRASPAQIQEEPRWHHLFVLHLFDDDDIIWVGRDLYDTGSKRHKWRFRTAKEWSDMGECQGTFTCPATFKAGTCSRGSANIKERKFLVVESDHLNSDEVGSIFQMLHHENGLTLRAVVDTAGKSLHGWFNMPRDNDLPHLKRLLSTLCCDPKMFGDCQPCRMPGAKRDGKYQTLIYFNENPN